MTGPCFVGADVFLYARDPRQGAKQARAAEWIAHLWRERLGRTSVQVLSEYYVIATEKLSPRVPAQAAWDDVRALFAWKPQPADEALLRRAREVEERWRLSWWESLVVAAAQLQECRLLLTEHLHDGAAFGDVIVHSPFKLAAEQPRAQYEVVPEPRSRHRPRGRPRAVRLPAHA